MGMAIRGYFTSPFHDEPWIESHLDLRDRDGNQLPGYGWIFPVGDGTVNVGAGLLDTFTGFKSVNTTKLMDAFVATAPARWGISPETVVRTADRRQAPDRRLGHARRPGRPGSSPVTPPARSTRSTARGSPTPTRPGGWSPTRCTRRSERRRAGARSGTPTQLEEIYGAYFKVARTFVKVIGNPAIMREVTRIGMHSRPLMEWVLRIMANLLRPDEIGPAEAAYKVVERLVAVIPDPSPPRLGHGTAFLTRRERSRVRELGGSGVPRGSLGATGPDGRRRGASGGAVPADPHDDRSGPDLRGGVVRGFAAAHDQAPDQGEDRAVRVRHRVRGRAGRAVPGALLPRGARVHRPRRRDHLPLPLHHRSSDSSGATASG